jgi:hypothetical protein
VNLLIGLVLTAATALTTPATPVAKTSPAATAAKIPVFLQTDAQDVVGAAYVARLREVLESSSAYRPVLNPAHARFIVGILTMDPNEAEAGLASGHSTVASVTLQRENGEGLNQFVYSWVLVARRDKVDALATELIAAIDKEIQSLEGVPAGMTIRFLDEAPAATK